MCFIWKSSHWYIDGRKHGTVDRHVGTSIYTAESFQHGVEGRSGDLVVDHAQFAFDVGLNLVAGDFTESVAYTITGLVRSGGHGFSRRKTSTLRLGDGDNVVVLDGVSRHDDNRNTVVEITAVVLIL